MGNFERINKGFNATFEQGRLSLGVVVPIENYAQTSVPTMQQHLERAKLAEELGFKALWVRDVPLHVPSFGDAGQTYDPFAYLGYLAGQTTQIALGVASIALPLHHPLHVAKSAATIDHLSGGRLILGVASGDRLEEYPAMNVSGEDRGALFRDAFDYIRKANEAFPKLENNRFGTLNGDADILPKAVGQKIPMLITGSSRQSPEWIASHGDGWMYYPRNLYMQEHNIKDWRALIAKNKQPDKPFMQPLYVDLQKEDDFEPQYIHLGFRTGVNYLVDYLKQLQNLGVNHVAINLRFNSSSIEETLEMLAQKLLPHFHATTDTSAKVKS